MFCLWLLTGKEGGLQIYRKVNLFILSHVFVTNNVGSGLNELIYLLLIPPVIARNYSTIALSALYNSLLHTLVPSVYFH
jgi:hypothetical protein